MTDLVARADRRHTAGVESLSTRSDVRTCSLTGSPITIEPHSLEDARRLQQKLRQVIPTSSGMRSFKRSWLGTEIRRDQSVVDGGYFVTMTAESPDALNSLYFERAVKRLARHGLLDSVPIQYLGVTTAARSIVRGSRPAGTVGGFVDSPLGLAALTAGHVIRTSRYSRRVDEIKCDLPANASLGQVLHLTRLRRKDNRSDLALVGVVGVDADVTWPETDGPQLGTSVFRIDARGERTDGTVTAVDVEMKIRFRASERRRFVDLVAIESSDGTFFSYGGDSGAIVRSSDDQSVVGMVIAGKPEDEEVPARSLVVLGRVMAGEVRERSE